MSSPSSRSRATEPPAPQPASGPGLARRLAIRFVLRPVVRFLLGVDVAGREWLPATGPAIVAPNHNSHLDVLVVMAAMPGAALARVRPVGAADTFLGGPPALRLLARFLGVIPLDRAPTRETAAGATGALLEALGRGEILVVFPEGTRGDPEAQKPVKSGLSRLAQASGAPIHPVLIQGAGRSLPRGSRLLVPFTCSVLCGPPIDPAGLDRPAIMAAYGEAMDGLRAAAPPLHWT